MANPDMIDELLTDDMISHGLGPDEKTIGRAPFKEFYDSFRVQMNNVHVALDAIMNDGDLECARCYVTGEDAQSGIKVMFTCICMSRIVNGQIAETWNAYDFLKMYQQRGFRLTPQPS